MPEGSQSNFNRYSRKAFRETGSSCFLILWQRVAYFMRKDTQHLICSMPLQNLHHLQLTLLQEFSYVPEVAKFCPQ